MQSGSTNQPKLNKMISFMDILKLIASLEELIDLIVVQTFMLRKRKEKVLLITGKCYQYLVSTLV